MAQITSREELEEWLKDKPADWAQVIAARAALRVLPYAFGQSTVDDWVVEHSLTLFRVTNASWPTDRFPATMVANAAQVGFSARAANSASHNKAPVAYSAIEAAAYAALAAYAARVDEYEPVHSAGEAADNAASAVTDAATRIAFWDNLSADCDWLDKSTQPIAHARNLTRTPLWPAGKPNGWSEAWVSTAARLRELDQGYSVWIDWYNRRVKGERAAFDIPGDVDRTQDKAILARLADSTNEDFWDKGATYVNTTLQGWIDEARERAAIDYVASGAPLKIGSDAELAARGELKSRLTSVEGALAALKDQLASLTQTGHGGIGHNQPENAGSLRDDEIALLQQKVASLEPLVMAAHTALTKPEPDVTQLVQLVPKLNRWSRAMQVVEDVTSARVREGIESWAGPAALGGAGYLICTTIPNALSEFSQYFYTYWTPILIG
jgi:hypothetical protein